MRIRNLIAFCVGLTFVLTGCTLEKRRYTKGFYAMHPGKANKRLGATTVASERSSHPVPFPLSSVSGPNEQEELQAGVLSHSIPTFNLSKPAYWCRKNRLTEPGDSCDIVLMRDGERVRARVLEIGTTEIKYKRCGLADGPLYIVRKADIESIQYSSGREETFSAFEQRATAHEKGASGVAQQRIMHPDALPTLALAICGWLILVGSIPAIIVGNKALREINAAPHKYSGESLITFSIVVSWLKIALMFVILVVVFTNLFLLF